MHLGKVKEELKIMKSKVDVQESDKNLEGVIAELRLQLQKARDNSLELEREN
jgi:hypothetical protein